MKLPPFLLVVDGKLQPGASVDVVFPRNDPGHNHYIEAHITARGVQVNVMDEHNTLIEAVYVNQSDGTVCAGDVEAPETNEEALEEVHAALTACMEHGVTLQEILSYLLSRAAEVALGKALPASEFTSLCLKVYEEAMVKVTEERSPVGSA